MARNKPLVLLSGGVDSAVALWQAAADRKAVALFVNYGQPAAAHEHAAAARLAAQIGCDIDFAVCSLPLGEMSDDTGASGPRVVPGRNAVLISLGAAYAVKHGCDHVVFGGHSGDDVDYPDCRAGFVVAMNAALLAYGVDVAAPLLGLGKRAVMAAAVELGVPVAATWSCYTPQRNGAPCGSCNSCIARAPAQA